jgi:hypothetical protein
MRVVNIMRLLFNAGSERADEDSRSVNSSRCNTEAHRHHERTCIAMDVIEVGAAFPYIFDRQVIRKALILDIGVCIMEEK